MAVVTALRPRVGLRYRRMSFDDTAEQLRRQEADVDALCELHAYTTEAGFLFTDEDESGNEDTRYRQGKGERPGLRALDRELHRLAAHGTPVTVVAWEPGRLFRDAGPRSTTSAGGPGLAMCSCTRRRVSGILTTAAIVSCRQ
jgi:hypothetical protein